MVVAALLIKAATVVIPNYSQQLLITALTPLVLLIPAVLRSMKNRKLAMLFQVGISICFIAFGLYSLRSEIWTRAYPYYAFWEW